MEKAVALELAEVPLVELRGVTAGLSANVQTLSPWPEVHP